MSILQSLVEWTQGIEEISGIHDAIVKLIEAEEPIEVAAATSQLIAELAVATVVTSTIRTSMACLRLGLAISGQIWKWEALSWAAGSVASLTAGSIIDWANEQNIGGQIYDGLHPDANAISTIFDKASKTTSPIIIDMDGDGIETLSKDQGIHFDLDNNQFAERTGWVGKDDALLVMDRDGNGRIDNGTELFGSETILSNGKKAANGFMALAELDLNGDGILDATDAAWADLKIWQDKNGDGISQRDELIAISDSGIASLKVDYTNQNKTDASGNQQKETSTVNWNDGHTSSAVDVWFAVNKADTIYHGDGTINTEVLALPWMRGFGEVLDLYIAMSKDAQLKGMVDKYVAATSYEERKNLLLPLIYQWCGVTNIDPNSRDPKKVYGHVMDARQLVALERITGQAYLGTWCWGERDPNPHGQAAPILIAEFNKFAAYIEAQLLVQTEFKDIFSQLAVHFDDATQTYQLDWSKFNEQMLAMKAAGQNEQLARLGKTIRALDVYSDTISHSFAINLQEQMVMNPDLVKLLDSHYFSGTGTADRLTGSSGKDYLNGLAGNDIIQGGAGDDTYYFNAGDGRDRVYDSAGKDQITFGGAVEPAKIKVTRDATSIYLTRLDANGQPTDDVIQLENFFNFNGNISEGVIESIVFDNGTVWTSQDLIAMVKTEPTESADQIFLDETDNTLSGLGGNDLILGGDGNDTLFGDAGDDNLIGDAGNDKLYGDAGNDTLNGGAGNDLLEGGDGNDVLDGGTGNDTYVFKRGNGVDLICENDSTSGNLDLLLFDGDITADKLWFSQNDNNLDIAIMGTDEKMSVQNWYFSKNYHIEQFKTADGKTLIDSQVQQLVNAMAGLTPPAVGATTLPESYQNTLNQVIVANWK
ncbi:calcium-binding protein [Aeromonas veronii]|uniref:calcium-binding protein n=1 Tax=Aeromonas veronii TaxID=654 RepID=UPI001E485084|nr:calcium-binding protein [Aeromonas veronii]MCD6619972.1 hypothetical protein [Aeromonas veronii]